jgi:hypothetical protein
MWTGAFLLGQVSLGPGLRQLGQPGRVARDQLPHPLGIG